MSNQNAHENQEWLSAWLRHRVKYDKEYLSNIDKFKSSVKNLNFSWQNLTFLFKWTIIVLAVVISYLVIKKKRENKIK